ncbi:MAG TPA: hypothetical protein VEI97_10220, partial [bacterium]|nr:hypothetical protein [bacterium]
PRARILAGAIARLEAGGDAVFWQGGLRGPNGRACALGHMMQVASDEGLIDYPGGIVRHFGACDRARIVMANDDRGRRAALRVMRELLAEEEQAKEVEYAV